MKINKEIFKKNKTFQKDKNKDNRKKSWRIEKEQTHTRRIKKIRRHAKQGKIDTRGTVRDTK